MDSPKINTPIPQQFWNVYNYVARQWYELEYGQVEDCDRWYFPTMLSLERMIAQKPVHHV